MSLNKVMLIGNVGKEPEVRHLESGVVKSSFTLATTERYRDRTSGEWREQTEWHNIICWRGIAEVVEKYVKKGTQVYVEGKITTRSYADKEGITRYTTEIVADSLQMLGRRSDAAGGDMPSGGYAQPAQRSYAPNQQPSNASTQYPQQQYAQPVQESRTSYTPDISEADPGDDLPF